MISRAKLTDEAIQGFVAAHAGWEARDGALSKAFELATYAEGIAFVVRLGFAAEARDHHPDVHLGWRRVRVTWSTHDAGGITAVDLEMAAKTDELSR